MRGKIVLTITVDAVPQASASADATLVEAAREDPRAFALLYDRHVETVYRYLLHQTGSPEVAEDLTSLTFMRALASLSRFRSTGAFLPWLMRIAHNAMVDFMRFRRRETRLDDAALALLAACSPGGLGQTPGSDLEQSESFLSYTEGLPKDQRHALALRFVADLSMEDTAAVLGRSAGATKMLIARAIASLRRRAQQGRGSAP